MFCRARSLSVQDFICNVCHVVDACCVALCSSFLMLFDVAFDAHGMLQIDCNLIENGYPFVDRVSSVLEAMLDVIFGAST